MSKFIPQHTLQRSAQLSGIGIHTGSAVQLTLHPAPENTGIIFRRVNLNPVVEIPATTAQVSDTRLNTCISQGSAAISTVEHVLSAIAGLGIDNAYIDVTSHEPPVMDGSAQPFIELINSVGITAQSAAKQFIEITREITVRDGDKFVSLVPFDGFKFNLSIDFDHPFIRSTPQSLNIDFAHASYAKEISAARTFGFLSEYEWLKQRNLGLGASLENTVVLDKTTILNPEGLRYPDEPVKHKLLDVIGDLRLLGHTIIGEFTGHKSGHQLNHQLRQALLQDTSAWQLVTRDATASLPVDFHVD
jgi:UDP-3-O-[3-hydroxymyristoyl] N-acetylglucosamine deacetylase